MQYYKKYINTDNGKDCHVFEAGIYKENKSYINIKNSIFSSHMTTKKSFTCVWEQQTIYCNKIIYTFWKNEDNIYFGNKDAIRIIEARILKEKMCCQCIATLY